LVTAGTRLGTYLVQELLGKGGMGEVWRARDSKLGRDVALKLLPADVAHDPERRRRFEREARLLAALNHPGIGSLYGLEEADGILFLVMEVVEGRTLAEKLLRGPSPIAEALELARQIAEAIEAAHGRGILHRDLKPQNIKVTPEGRVKLLDFGLAKVLEAGDSDAPFSDRQTATTDSTSAGLAVGTAPYMSPEQAKGDAADRRTDVWAFGCVLFEMVTGRRAFPGPTRSEAIAAVLAREPDWSALPSDTPSSVRMLLTRCLRKDKNERLHDIADARIELKDAASSAPPTNPGASASSVRAHAPGRLRSGAWSALVLASAFVLAWAVWLTRAKPSVAIPRLTISAPPGRVLADDNVATQHLALAPDGRRVAFLAGPSPSPPRIYLRDVSAIESTALTTAERTSTPFFSPDGRWVGYQEGLDLRRAPVDGGPPVRICTLPPGSSLRGATWGDRGEIVFTPSPNSGLWSVAATGGTPRKLSEPAAGEGSHRWPQMLPGSRVVLFTVSRGWFARDARLEALVLSTGERRVVIEGSGFARYSPTGHLLFAQSGRVLATTFDVATLEVSGAALPVIDDVHMNFAGHAYADFDVAPSGSLVYVPGSLKAVPRTLFWVDRSGEARPVHEDERDYVKPRISPDGRRLVVRVSADPESLEQWLLDLERGTWLRVTNDGRGDGPVWSPDGEWLAYLRGQGLTRQLFIVPADLRRPPEPRGPPLRSGSWNTSGWSPDGRFVVFQDQRPDTGWDIGIQPIDGGEPRWLLATPAAECCAALSPDGRWMAYVTREPGDYNVYVTSFPEPGERHRISPKGGAHVRWSRDGRELYYRTLGERRKLMAVAADTRGRQPRFGAPRPLFDDTFLLAIPYAPADYDVAPDGRFVFVEDPPESPVPRQLVLIPDFASELRARLRAASR
jgi:eukaryotic-like serine/threonine-protein kinase